MSIQLVFTDFLDLSFGLTAIATLPQLEVTTPTGDFQLERDISVDTLKSVFYFQTDDPITYDASYTKYFVDISGWSSTISSDLNPMNYEVLSTVNGAYGTNISDNLGKHFLRYIAEELFGTYLGVDLFNNEDVVYEDISMNAFDYVYTEVLNKLKRVDKVHGVTSDLTDIFEDEVNGWHMRDSDGTYNICRNLVRQIAGSSVAKVRFEDLEVRSGFTSEDGIYNVPFIVGDSIYYSVVVTPDPNQHLTTGLSTAISSKKYILKLNVVAA
jgi:hypothetical protein